MADVTNLDWIKQVTCYLSFSLLPRKCAESGKRIWFTKAYTGVGWLMAPGLFMGDRRWFDKNEFIKLKLQV